jgi:hypothetical protein
MAAVLPTGSDKIMGLGAKKITKIFVGFDILSFLIQGSGSGVASSNNWQGPTEVTGAHILIAGLATQLATILVFIVIVVLFSKRTLLESRVKSNAPNGWEKVLMAISLSVVLIAVRILVPIQTDFE